MNDTGWHRDSPDLTEAQRAILRREDEAEAELEAERRASGKQCIYTNGTICVHERKNPNTLCDGVTKCCAVRDDGEATTTSGVEEHSGPATPETAVSTEKSTFQGPEVAAVLSGERQWCVLCADNRDVLRDMPDGCIDACVCDPPYEIGFMSRTWDATGIANDVDVWREVLRVLKPGGHMLAFGGTRTYHRMACAIEDAGFDVRDSLHWITSQGMPKGANVAKATESEEWQGWRTGLRPAHEPIVLVRKPLDGLLAHNVLTYGTGALNIDGCRTKFNSDADRDEAKTKNQHSQFGSGARQPRGILGDMSQAPRSDYDSELGRWPTNVLLGHSPGCRQVGTKVVMGDGHWPSQRGQGGIATCGHAGQSDLKEREDTAVVQVWQCVPGCVVAAIDAQSGERPGMSGGGAHRDGYQGGMFGGIDCEHTARGDGGGCSRFFPTFSWSVEYDMPFRYVPKASRAEREAGCERLPVKTRGEITGREDDAPGSDNPRSGKRATGGIHNHHPTVKPIALMQWLCRLVTPPGGVVLDCFAGSGTTIAAARMEGLRAIGIEREPEYVAIAQARVDHRVGGGPLQVVQTTPEPSAPQTNRKQLDLFGSRR